MPVVLLRTAADFHLKGLLLRDVDLRDGIAQAILGCSGQLPGNDGCPNNTGDPVPVASFKFKSLLFPDSVERLALKSS